MELPESKNGNVKFAWVTNILVLFVGALILTVWNNLSSQVHDMQSDIHTLQVQMAEVSVLNARMDDLNKRQDRIEDNRSAEAQDYIEAQALGDVGEREARAAKMDDLAHRARRR